MSFNNFDAAMRELHRVCAFKLRGRRTLYSDSRPAQRYISELGRVRYRPWQSVTGGKWIKGAAVIGAKVKLLSNDGLPNTGSTHRE